MSKPHTPRLPALPLALALSLICCGVSAAGEFEMHPALAVSEEYNSNVFDEVAHPQTDFITRVHPGLAMLYHAPRLEGNAAYAIDYRTFARGSASDQVDHDASLSSKLTLVDNFFYLDLSDTMTRVSLDIARNQTLESTFLNQTNQNAAVVSPYLLWRLGSRGVLKTGYSYLDTRYWNSGALDKQENLASADYTHELSARFTLEGGYSFRHVRTDQGKFSQHDVFGGARYAYGEGSSIFGSIGNNWTDFSLAGSGTNLFWAAGVTHNFGTMVGTLETRVVYTEDPLTLSTKQTVYNGRIDRAFDRGTVGIYTSYTEYAITQTGRLDRAQVTVGGTGRYEFSPKLAGTASLLADRYTRHQEGDFPYHFAGSAGLTYDCNHGIALSVNYSWITYRFAVDSATGARDTNRVVLEARTVF